MKPLTAKQQRIAELISDGMTSEEVAREMGIGRRTVDDHRKAIFQKLEVRNAAEMVRKMLGEGE